MTHASCSRRVLLLAVLIFVGAALGTACRRATSTAAEPAAGGAPPDASSSAASATPVGAYDVEITDLARVLAGMTPTNAKPFVAMLGQQAWREYEAEARARWSGVWAVRLRPLRSWAGTSLKVPGGCPTLLQPFGGSDFVAAYLAFPSCDGYLLVGAEPAGQLPAAKDFAAGQALAFAQEVKQAFPDVFLREDGGPATAGRRRPSALVALLVQLARLDARIVSASWVGVTPDGHPLDPVPIRENVGAAAFTLTFEVPGGRPQSLTYLQADVDDVSIRRQPGTWTFLRLQAPFVTVLTDNASQGEHATLVRKLILEQSRAILERPGAVPPRLLPPADWTVTPLEPPPAAARALHGSVALALKKMQSGE